MSAGKAMYPTLEAYYADDERRLRSEECDYGAHWRLKGWEGLWRISYVRNIGEIYAVHQGSTVGPVFILAIIPLDPKADCDRRSLFYATLMASWTASQSSAAVRTACAGSRIGWPTST